MIFTRTTSGLANQCLFYNVDAVVFTEGGNVSWSIDNVYSGDYNEKSIDIIFWRKLFNKFNNEVNLKFKAVGSKNTVSAIALEIESNNMSTVIAAMDSEFDEIHNKKIGHPNVLYTKGYSWENDVWNTDITISILEELSGNKVENEIIETCVRNFHETILDGVCADAVLFGNNDSLLLRKGHLKCVTCSETASPVLKTQFLNDLLEASGLNMEDVRLFGSNNNITSDQYCYGHLLNDFYYHLIRYVSKVILEIKIINKDLLENLAISKFEQMMTEDKSDYYKAIIISTVPNKA